MIKRILLAGVLIVSCLNIFATHIIGGELNYKCLGNNQYEIHLRVYRDCYTGVPPFDNPATVGIFDVNNVRIQNVAIPFPGKIQLPPTLAQVSPCVKTPTNVCVEVCEYVATVTLPPKTGGYQLAYQRCCRNPTIVNVTNPSNFGATYYAQIPDQSVTCNGNPVFKNWPPIFVCAGSPIVFDHSATDINGDSIVYNLCTPFVGLTANNPGPVAPDAPPYSLLTWKTPYDVNNLLGGTSPLTIDPKTGLLTGTPNTIGQFVVGVCADEYRFGNLISTTKRDFQFNVISCQPDLVVAPTVGINCTTNTATFINNSTGAASFFWDFGDPTVTNDTSDLKNPTYTYPGLGAYLVKLIVRSTINSICNDTLKNFAVKVGTCPACTMTLGITKTDASCVAGGCTTLPIPLSDWTNKTPPNPDPCPGTGIFVYFNNVTDPIGTSPSNSYYMCDATYQSATSAEWITKTVPAGSTCPGTGSFVQLSGGGFGYLCGGCTATPGNATVVPTGGSMPFTYAWSTNPVQTGATATNLGAGTYTVTVQDATGVCVNTANVIIDANSDIALAVSQTLPSLCGAADATATVVPSGGKGPFTYSWSTSPVQTTPTATGLAAGTYTIIASDSLGCNKSAIITIGQHTLISITTSKTDVVCKGANNGTATVTLPLTGATPYSCVWSTNPVQTGTTATGLPAGYYIVTVTDAKGCTVSSSVSIADTSICTGVHETTKQVYSISPNPTTEIIYVNAPNKIDELFVTDILGKAVRAQYDNISQVDISQQEPGIYFVRFRINDCFYFSKIIKE